jgi:hypothetical protein
LLVDSAHPPTLSDATPNRPAGTLPSSNLVANPKSLLTGLPGSPATLDPCEMKSWTFRRTPR